MPDLAAKLRVPHGKYGIGRTDTIEGVAHVECPSCGLTFKVRRRDRVAISRQHDETAIVVFRRHVQPTRRVLHTCIPPRQRADGDPAPVPALPPDAPPAREGSIALDIPTGDASR